MSGPMLCLAEFAACWEGGHDWPSDRAMLGQVCCPDHHALRVQYALTDCAEKLGRS